MSEYDEFDRLMTTHHIEMLMGRAAYWKRSAHRWDKNARFDLFVAIAYWLIGVFYLLSIPVFNNETYYAVYAAVWGAMGGLFFWLYTRNKREARVSRGNRDAVVAEIETLKERLEEKA